MNKSVKSLIISYVVYEGIHDEEGLSIDDRRTLVSEIIKNLPESEKYGFLSDIDHHFGVLPDLLANFLGAINEADKSHHGEVLLETLEKICLFGYRGIPPYFRSSINECFADAWGTYKPVNDEHFEADARQRAKNCKWGFG